MKFTRFFLILITLFSTQQLLAADTSAHNNSDSKSCTMIADACRAAGFGDSENKRFWQDCMKPIILGQSVNGVTVEAATVKTCRKDKIEELKKEIKEYQKVK